MKGVETSGVDRGRQAGDGFVGHYRLLRVLGEGGMGVVHLAEDPDGRRVAIKVLRPGVAADQTAIRRLAREVDTMRRVHSPFVSEILDADVTATRPYVVTQYVPGRTLEEIVLEQGPLSGRSLQRLATGLAQALAAIHGAGVIHRDLKPGNVMLQGEQGQPVLIDFGIAQGLDATRLTATGMVIGTPGYLAPEIIEGEEAGPPADVHAWAATLAFAATGRPPFGSGTFESIFFKIMQSTPDLGGVPAPMLPLIRAAMARHPAERPTAVTLVQLARRIDLDATITDQTRLDRPLSDFGLPGPSSSSSGPASSSSGPSHSGSASSAAVGAAALGAAASFSGAAEAAPGAAQGAPGSTAAASNAPAASDSAHDMPGSGDGAARGRETRLDETLVDASWREHLDQHGGSAGRTSSANGQDLRQTAADHELRDRERAVQQPKDFVGMLPPVPPPPPPVREERRGPRPYTPPPQGQRSAYAAAPPPGYLPYAQQPGVPPQNQPPYGPQGGYPPQGQHPYGAPQDPSGTRPDRQGADPQSAKPERRKPYGWYRLCSLLSLAVVLGLAAFAPVMTLGLALAGAVLLRSADRAARGMESKRTRRGPGSGDVLAAAVKMPFALPGALLKTALWGGLHLFLGVALVVVLMVANPTMTVAKALSYGVMAILALHFAGPGSAGPRRQMARFWGAFLPRIEPAVIVAVCLAVFAGVLGSVAVKTTPDLQPVRFSQSTKTLDELKNDIKDKLPFGWPFG